MAGLGAAVISLCVSIGCIFGSAAAAIASPAPYPPPQCAQVTVSSTVVAAGESLIVSGKGFAAHSPVEVELKPSDRVLARGATGADGEFSLTVRFPAGLHGQQVIAVVGGHPSCPVPPVTITIGSNLPAGGSPASTGVDVLAELAVAIGLLALGALLAASGRSRRGRSRRGRRLHIAAHSLR